MNSKPKSSTSGVEKGIAEVLPLDDQSVDVAIALITVHQWSDLSKRLGELCRATRKLAAQ